MTVYALVQFSKNMWDIVLECYTVSLHIHKQEDDDDDDRNNISFHLTKKILISWFLSWILKISF